MCSVMIRLLSNITNIDIRLTDMNNICKPSSITPLSDCDIQNNNNLKGKKEQGKFYSCGCEVFEIISFSCKFYSRSNFLALLDLHILFLLSIKPSLCPSLYNILLVNPTKCRAAHAQMVVSGYAGM